MTPTEAYADPLEGGTPAAGTPVACSPRPRMPFMSARLYYLAPTK